MAGNRIKGITIEIDGNTTKLSKALEGVNKSLKTTSNDLKDVNRLLKLDPTNAELLKQKSELLNKAIEDTNKKLQEEKKAFEALKNAPQTEETKRQQELLTREIIDTEQELKSLEKQARETGNAFTESMKVAGEKMQEVGTKVEDVGKDMTTKLTLPIVAVGGAIVKTTADFDTSMSKVQALSGATGDEFDALRDKAQELGQTSAFSASQVADGFSYMSLAGWSTEEMLDGISGVLNLASAGQMDLAQASDIVTDYLSAFNLEAKDATVIADMLAYAQANSNTTVEQLAEAYKNSASNMNASGQTIQTTTALLEAMANQGNKGATAGTALSAIMRDLRQNAEDGTVAINDHVIALQDEDGNYRDLIDILTDVSLATEGLGTAERDSALGAIFTARSLPALNQVMNEGIDTVRGYRDELNQADGTAQGMADTMLNNLSGQITILKSQLEGIAIQLGDILMPIIMSVVEKIQAMLDWFLNLDEGTKTLILTIAGLVAGLGPVLVIVGNVIKVFGALSSIAGVMGTTIGAIAGPIGIAIGAITAIIAIGVLLYKNWDTIKAKAIELWNSLKTSFGNIKTTVSTVWNGIKKTIGDTWDSIKTTVSTTISTIASSISTTFNSIKTTISTIWNGITTTISTAVDTVKTTVSTAFNTVSTTISTIINGIKTAISTTFNSIKTTVTTVVDVIKNAFNFKWSLPSIKMPHFRVSGSLNPIDWLKNGVPSFSVDWYRKAYDTPILFNTPTVIPTMNGFKGFGDGNGSEVVMSLNRLQQMVGATAQPTINVTVNGVQGQNVNELANVVIQKLTTQINRNNGRW